MNDGHGLEAVYSGHGYVGHHQIRAKPVGQRDKFLAIRCFSEYLDAWKGCQQKGDATAHQLVIICQNHSIR